MILFIIKACLIFMTGHGMSSCSRWHEDTYYHHINIFDLLRFMNSAANFLYFIVRGKCPWRKIIAAEWGDIAVLPLEISDPNAEAACKHDRNALWACLRDVRSDTRHSAVLGGLQFHSASDTLVYCLLRPSSSVTRVYMFNFDIVLKHCLSTWIWKLCLNACLSRAFLNIVYIDGLGCQNWGTLFVTLYLVPVSCHNEFNLTSVLAILNSST